MSTRYCRLRLSGVETTNSDRSGGRKIEPADYDFTCDEAMFLPLEITTTAETFDLSFFTTITNIVIVNTDPDGTGVAGTDYVMVTWRNTENGANDNKARVEPGQILSLGAVTPSADLTLDAQTTTRSVEIWIFGT